MTMKYLSKDWIASSSCYRNNPMFSALDSRVLDSAVHALRWHNPAYADILVMAPEEQPTSATGLIFSGSDIVAGNSTP